MDRSLGRRRVQDRTEAPLQIDADTGLAFITFRVPPEAIKPLVERATRQGLSSHMTARAVVLEWCRDQEAEAAKDGEHVPS